MDGKHLRGRYLLTRQIGVGGMGEVWLAEDKQLERQVAVKLLPATLADDADRRRRFLTEARAASALNHPNVCVIHEASETDDGRPYIVMEYLEGQPLNELASERAMEIVRIVEIATQIADALDTAHVNGIVHRDIKPANIIINARGQVKVLDFGLAKRLADDTESDGANVSTRTQAGSVIGTPGYMSPEQALGRQDRPSNRYFQFGGCDL